MSEEQLSKSALRDEVVDQLHQLIVGPIEPDELIEGRLNLRYFAGILFPKGSSRSGLAQQTSESLDEDTTGSVPESGDEFSGDADNPLSQANEALQSSVGLSFTIERGSSFRCEVSAAQYFPELLETAEPSSGSTRRSQKNTGWRRKATGIEEIDVSAKDTDYSVFSGLAKISILRRPSRFQTNLEIVTVSLLNSASLESEEEALESQVKKRLYQVKMAVSPLDSPIQSYDSPPAGELDFEDQILELQYQDSPIFAVGHGASCGWDLTSDGIVTRVYIDFVPTANVLRPRFDTVSCEGEDFEDTEIFKLAFLADQSVSPEELIKRLNSFVAFYERWVKAQTKVDVGDLVEARDHLIQEMETCISRMRSGISMLQSEPDCLRAFQLANLVMLRQRSQAQYLKNLRAERRQAMKPWPIPSSEQHLIESPDPFSNNSMWRPFQLAFCLMVLPDLEPELSLNDRAVDPNSVDLIWFSTGGGKTEAYMLVTAYELIRRRARFGEISRGKGTGVLTRYTLRFLTADQFLRTVSLTCALEYVRTINGANQQLLGGLPEDRFTVGLYVGSDTGSYAKIVDAEEALSKLKDQRGAWRGHKFQLTECPECGTALIPAEDDANHEDNSIGYRTWGIEISNQKLLYRCVNENCVFSIDNGLPVNTIDQQIYADPPSILMGTVDKFAMLSIRGEEGSKLFGVRRGNPVCAPPTLIIQDELHLISGPLGTIVSIYEAAFDTVIRQLFGQLDWSIDQRGCKFISSSATVRESDAQIRHLTALESRIFPPRGVRAGDSFFATVDTNINMARRYIGLMGQSLRSTSSAHWACAAILQSVRYLAEKYQDNSIFDFLWTLLVYSNSKRELGLIKTAVNSEIYDRMKVYSAYQGADPDAVNELKNMEISSTVVENIVDMRDELTRPNDEDGGSGCLDIVPCTNMISVGVDIDRLGLMLVNGQPKTTSEYIQASSRVGRDPVGRGPGLVLTLYSPAKPRDRSHYENFVGYHESIYRFVEPTSVTPGSEKALERALHAAIVIAIRLSLSSLRKNNQAGAFSASQAQEADVLEMLKTRLLACYSNDPDATMEKAQIVDAFDRFVGHWNQAAHKRSDLVYYNQTAAPPRLLRYFMDREMKNDSLSTRTMSSMRGVDTEILLSQVERRD